jgi:hypothetical protein
MGMLYEYDGMYKENTMTNQVHIVMIRYTLDCSPLDEADDYAQYIRGVFSDLEKATLLADELESTYGSEDSTYFVASHNVVS